MPGSRYAISYTPPPDSPLSRFGAGILGYDCFSGAEVPHSAIAGIDPAILRLTTLEPRRYGFHAALVAPFEPGESREDELIAAFGDFTRRHRPVAVGALAPARLDRFVILRPAARSAQLEDLVAACREAVDEFRAPAPSEFPSEAFRLHMALAGPIPDDEIKPFKERIAAAFRPLAADQVEIDAMSLMRLDDRSGRFHVVERHRLSGR